MRKNATKIAAMMLSLALTVTSVNVPTTSSAATKVKLNKTKATLYVGGASSKKTTTLKATFKGKKVKATFTSNKSKVAKVGKSTGKVTAVKKGTATITAKYSGKKATCKVTVKQYVTNITAPASVDLKVGEIVDLNKQVTVTPSNANNKALSYVSDESLTAAINAAGTTLKGVKEGTTVIKIKAKDGSAKTAQVQVNVKPADAPAPTDDPGTETPAPSNDKEATEIKMGLENPFSDTYSNAVLIGTNAFVKVQLLDADGKPVANKEVELTAKRLYPETYADANEEKRISMFGNVSENVKKTDSNGYVTFDYGLAKTTDPVDGEVIDATKDEFVSSFKLTATAVDNTALKASMDVKFGALLGNAASSGITIRNQLPETGYNALVPSVNTGATTVAETKGRNEENIKYVSSQQVSTTGVDHKVTFNSGLGGVTLKMPGDEKSGAEAERLKEEINWSTDKYLTYSGEQANTRGGWVLKGVEASQLQYATVRFSKLKLSKYSRFLVRAYIVANKDNPSATTPVVAFAPNEIDLKASESDLSGPRDITSDFSVQIPVSASSGYLYVTAEIISKGQVNTDLNEGFTVKNIEGVKKPGASSTITVASNSIPGLEIKWAMDNEVTYTVDQKFDQYSVNTADAPLADIYANMLSRGFTDQNQFSYKTPAFPATGNAIITVRDNAGKVVAYFATPTQNRIGANGKPDNVNILPPTAVTNMYQISEEEATQINVGEVSQNGNDLVVDSTKSGVTHAVGTITSTDGTIKINDSNREIYTSVQWNPVKNQGPASENPVGTAAAAFVGQNLVLRAQLVDANGNAVSTANEPIEFYQNTDANKIGTDHVPFGDASVVKVDEKTNAKGQAELILNSGSIEEVVKVYAKAKNSSFNIKYYLGNPGEEVTAAYVDLYWVDANLMFEPGTGGGANVVTDNANPVVKAQNIYPTVGENWAYEVRAYGDRKAITGTTLANYAGGINITGLAIQTSVEADSVGTTSDVGGGKALATSTKSGLTYIVNALNSNSITNDVKFYFWGTGGSLEVKYAGEGTAMLSKKLTLDVNWNHSVPTVNFIIPTGRQADKDATEVYVYVEVKDANGNPIKDRTVTLEEKGNYATLGAGPDAVNSAADDTKWKSDTNANGIAAFKVMPTASPNGLTSQLVARVSGMEEITQSSIKWITPPENLTVTHAEYKDADKTITLTFSDNVSAESVIPAMFDVEYDQDGAGATYTEARQVVKEVKVSGKQVVLSVPYITSPMYDSTFRINITTAKDTNGITYKLVGVDANKLVLDQNGTISGNTVDYYALPNTFTVGDGRKAF